tara:strand:+ start:775 stop:1056 length:282 start_codon:yes stop_codon:yes gene_type:complete
MSAQVINVASQLETQSVNAVVAGFSFASALAWMDVVRFVIGQLVKVNKNGAQYVLLTALMTTLLSIVVYMVIARFSKKVAAPAAPQYAVTVGR